MAAGFRAGGEALTGGFLPVGRTGFRAAGFFGGGALRGGFLAPPRDADFPADVLRAGVDRPLGPAGLAREGRRVDFGLAFFFPVPLDLGLIYTGRTRDGVGGPA